MTEQAELRFRISLPEDGRELVGSVRLPPLRMGPGLPPPPDVAGRAIAKALVPSIAQQIEPHLPAASPARRVIQRDATGQITGSTDVSATPPPAIRAAQIAGEIAAEMGTQYSDSIRRGYLALAEKLRSSRP